ncbi:MAG: hypothetical protein HY558_02200, partial [Euryarchaeota archaeon]|nr:hypothetical protein [Euryarchaeota archaeon]
NTTGYIINDNPLYTVDSLYVHIRPMTGAFSACTGVTGGGLAVNWTRSTSSSEWGHIYYLPTLRGSLNDSRGFYTFRENLRPIFNLFGTCRIEVSYSDGISTSNSTIYC